MRDPRKKKARDLRRIARSDMNRILSLFDIYHPEIKQLVEEAERRLRVDRRRFWWWLTPEWHYYQDQKHEWATKIAGYWDAIGGAPPAWFRRSYNRQLRSRQKAALDRAIRDDALDDFLMPRERCNIRWEWW